MLSMVIHHSKQRRTIRLKTSDELPFVSTYPGGRCDSTASSLWQICAFFFSYLLLLLTHCCFFKLLLINLGGHQQGCWGCFYLLHSLFLFLPAISLLLRDLCPLCVPSRHLCALCLSSAFTHSHITYTLLYFALPSTPFYFLHLHALRRAYLTACVQIGSF